jgi:hypothetical protein
MMENRNHPSRRRVSQYVCRKRSAVKKTRRRQNERACTCFLGRFMCEPITGVCGTATENRAGCHDGKNGSRCAPAIVLFTDLNNENVFRISRMESGAPRLRSEICSLLAAVPMQCNLKEDDHVTSPKEPIAGLTLILTAAVAHEVYAQVRLNQLMIDKLQNSQKLLEGIALGKFDMIEKHANELVRISKTAEWLAAHKKPQYELFSNEFQRAAEEIAKKAKAKNMDGVTLAYFDLTKSCVRYHEHLREVRDAGRT